MQPSILALTAQPPSRRLLRASAALVAGIRQFSLTTSGVVQAHARGGEAPATAASLTALPLAATSAIADPALGQLIDLHRRTTYVPGALAQRPPWASPAALPPPHAEVPSWNFHKILMAPAVLGCIASRAAGHPSVRNQQAVSSGGWPSCVASSAYVVAPENFESIHNHSAHALIAGANGTTR